MYVAFVDKARCLICPQGVRVVLTDGAAHAVDSSELAFRIAAVQGFRQAYALADPLVLEPIMRVEVTVPNDYQGTLG